MSQSKTGRSDHQARLTNVFDVAGDLVIDRDTNVGDFFVIVKSRIAVTSKVITNNRAKDIRIANHAQSSTWSIKCGPNIPWRRDVDCLGYARVDWADPIELHMPRSTIVSRRRSIYVVCPDGSVNVVIVEVRRLGTKVSGKINLGVNALLNRDRTSDIAVHYNCHVR